MLGAIEPPVHVLEKAHRVVAFTRNDAAAANAHGEQRAYGRIPVHDLRLAQRLLAALGHRARGMCVAGGQQQHELLAAVAGQEIARTVRSAAQGLGHAPEAFVALHMAVRIVVALEEVHIEEQQRQRLHLAPRFLPLAVEDGVELAAVVHAREAVAERQVLELLLQAQQLFLALLALGDVEHEAHERHHLALQVAHHVHHVADPHIAAVRGKRAVIGFVVYARLGLCDAEVDHALAVVGMDAVGPVLHRGPARGLPAQQAFDLRADIGKGRRRPVDLPRNGARGFQQGAIQRTIGFGVAHGTAWISPETAEHNVRRSGGCAGPGCQPRFGASKRRSSSISMPRRAAMSSTWSSPIWPTLK